MDGIDWKSVVFNSEEKSLILSDQKLSSVPESIINLYHNRGVLQLDLSYNKLKSLSGIAYFRTLENLILDNNQLEMIGGGRDEFSRPNQIVNSTLKLLSLNNNKISNLDQLLANLAISFPNLTYLSLLGNPCCPDNLTGWSIINPINEINYKNYRRKCCRMIPKLMFLDSTKVSKEDFESEINAKNQLGIMVDKLKSFKNVIKELSTEEENVLMICSPLPESNREPGQHKTAYGKKRFRYLGKESEGNRFIFNNDL